MSPRRREGPRLHASGFFYADFYVGFGPDGQRFRYSLRTRDPIQAQFRYEQELKRRWSAYYGVESPGRRYAASFVDLGREFVGYLRDTRKASTWKLSRDRLNVIHKFWQDIDLSQITKQKLADLDKWLAAKGRSEYTRNHYSGLLKSLFNFAIKEKKFFGENPVVGIKPYVVEQKRREYSADELERIAKAADEIERVCPRRSKTLLYMGRIVRLLLYTGMRLNELLNLKWENIQSDRIVLKPTETKTRREKTIPITPAIQAALDSLPRSGSYVIPVSHAKSGRLDMSIALRKLREASGVSDFLFHGLRHTAASIMVSEALGRGVGLADIMAVLGHHDIATTLRYQHSDLGRMRRAMEALEEKLKK